MATEVLVLELQVVLLVQEFPTSSTQTTGFGYIQGLWYLFYTTPILFSSQGLATAEYSKESDY